VDGEPLSRLTLSEFSQQLASAEPVPGGGSASAVVGSFAGSLLAMVARLSLDRPKYEPYSATAERAREAGDHARGRFLELAEEDARAYAAFAAARRMPRESVEETEAREAASRTAARAATEVPVAVAGECVRLLDEISAMAGRSNLNAASDLEVAARLVAAAAHGAAANAMINLPMIGDERYAGATRATLRGMLNDIDRTLATVSQTINRGGLREPESE
jgi:glutamate formiminotransferase/formiminotetrahydrofolate cyclodeaminase